MRQRPVSSGRVLVTGASRGIGRAVVAALVARKARVAAVARNERALDSVAAIDPSRIRAVPGDVDDPETRAGLVDRAADALGGLDGMVGCAGVVRYAQVGAIREEDVQAQVSTNLVAPLMLAQAAGIRMRDQGEGGAIVHVASTLAYKPAPSTTVYAATKAAVVGMTRSLAAELAPQGVRVNAVAPGVVNTDMVRVPRVEPGEPEPTGPNRDSRVARQIEELTRLHPLGQLGRPEDIAQAIIYLLDASWTTGSTLVTDGGTLLG